MRDGDASMPKRNAEQDETQGSVAEGEQAAAVTELVTEERREDVALFRMTRFGDVSHLTAHGEPPAFSGRFRECYGNDWERKD